MSTTFDEARADFANAYRHLAGWSRTKVRCRTAAKIGSDKNGRYTRFKLPRQNHRT
jgi:hypothetical protein